MAKNNEKRIVNYNPCSDVYNILQKQSPREFQDIRAVHRVRCNERVYAGAGTRPHDH